MNDHGEWDGYNPQAGEALRLARELEARCAALERRADDLMARYFELLARVDRRSAP